MKQDLKAFYQLRIDDFSDKLKRVESKSRSISFYRLFIFLAGLGAVYFFAGRESPPGVFLSILLSAILFIVLVKVHAAVIRKKNLLRAYRKINTQEKEGIGGNHTVFDPGEEFCNPIHDFVDDLDVFGRGSLFQYLNRSCTIPGYKKLASLLSHPLLYEEEIIRNQEAIKELSEKLEWRQKFQAIGVAYKEGQNDRGKIENWANSKPLFKSPVFLALVIVLPLVTAIMIVLLALGNITFSMFFLYMVVPWATSGMFAIRVSSRHNQVSKTAEMLLKYALLLEEIRQFEVKAPKLIQLKTRISKEEQNAAASIKALSAILTALDNRLNFVSWTLLNGLLVWDIMQMIRLEAWQKKNKQHVQAWFEVVAEIDALCCFGNFKYNQPKLVFPELIDDPFKIEAEEAGHPLIPEKVRINNEIKIRSGQFRIITGANMAGKSTYLRTIGVNLLLAMCGAPVCAKRFVFKPIRLYTSIRTKDSLYENESYFYAELKRLQAIIAELRKGEKLFIILDEILKGTNSKDKHAGSEALLKQLINFEATGVVATHDVLLGKLSETFPDQLSNQCFEVQIQGNKLNFDYKLREGISKNMNATILMREMGITI